ncbi:helix-turn-helix domain-containing protein [Mycobacterium sp. 134]|uniref:helix-turn-helix domain-containing protein n=1 Tax=Mycobacterium sp. 134 TaxID=3400425 RepID=UPI003AAD3A1E
MENLLELINRILNERGETVTAFASRIGVNRLTVTRWKVSLPAPQTLRRIADALDIPYSHVVMAALASAGYATCPADLLAGQQVHIITRSGGPYDEPTDVAVAAAFADPARASEYLHVASAITPDADIDASVVSIDGTEIPATVRVFTTIWSSRTDQIHQAVALCGSRPARLQDRDVTDVQATALADSEQAFSLQVDSLTPDAGRAALMIAIAMLRKQGRLLPPGVDPYHGLTDSMTYALQANGSAPQPPRRANATSGGSVLQTVPSTFAAARSRDRDAAASGQRDTSAAWPAIRQFFVELPG